jgi:hypothetical protein
VARKKSGLGVDAFFEDLPDSENENAQQEASNGKPGRKPVPYRREKIRKTFVIYRDTQLAIEMMKFEAAKDGKSVSFSEILEEAVDNLMEKKGFELPR